MINEIVSALAGSLKDDGFIENPYGLGLFVTRNKQKILAAFYGTTEVPVNWDNNNTACVFLLNGQVSVTQADDDIEAGGVLQTKRVPLRLFCYCNNATGPIPEALAQNIIGSLCFQVSKELQARFKLRTLTMAITGEEFRRDVVWNQVYQNDDVRLGDSQFLFALDFDLTIEGSPECWVIPCTGGITTENNEQIISENNQNIIPE